jgi:hypothetical protein
MAYEWNQTDVDPMAYEWNQTYVDPMAYEWNQTYGDPMAYEWKGSYTYSSIVGGSLHLQVGIISLPVLEE